MAFRDVLAATPFLIVLITFLLAGADDVPPGADLVDMAVPGRFLTTVDVLPSLDSLMPLTLGAVRVAGLAGCDAVVVPLVRAVLDAPPERSLEEELGMVDVVFARARLVAAVVVPPRVARAFSTMLVMMFEVLVGETGRAMPDFTGDGLVVEDDAAVAAAPRGAMRELEDAGERTWAGLRAISAAGPRRAFLGPSRWSSSFSLSPPEMSRLFWGGG